MDDLDLYDKIRDICKLMGIDEKKLNFEGTKEFIRKHGQHSHYEVGVHFTSVSNDKNYNREFTGLEAITLEIKNYPSRCPGCLGANKRTYDSTRSITEEDWDYVQLNGIDFSEFNLEDDHQVIKLYEKLNKELNPTFFIYDRTEDLF